MAQIFLPVSAGFQSLCWAKQLSRLWCQSPSHFTARNVLYQPYLLLITSNIVFCFIPVLKPQKLKGNDALVNPVTTPQPALSRPPPTSSLCGGRQRRSRRGEASVPALFYNRPPKRCPKIPLCGLRETPSSHHLMHLQLCTLNGLWWILIRRWILASFMIIMARKWRKQERSGWRVVEQKKNTMREHLSTPAKDPQQFRDHLTGSEIVLMCVKQELNLEWRERCCI